MGEKKSVLSQAQAKKNADAKKNNSVNTLAQEVGVVGNMVGNAVGNLVKVVDWKAKCDKQGEELKEIRALLDAEKKRADAAEQKAAAWEKKAKRAQEEAMRARKDAEVCRATVWNLRLHLNGVTEFLSGQNSEYGKLCNKGYLDIQQLLGNERAGVETGEQRKDLLYAIRHFISAREREQETVELPAQSVPPENWQMVPEIQKLMLQEKKAFQPERAFRLLTEKLLVVLEAGSAEQITNALHSCGVDAVFFDDAPLEYRNSDFYGYYDSGIDIPALVGKKADSGELLVLSRGAHVTKVDRE